MNRRAVSAPCRLSVREEHALLASDALADVFARRGVRRVRPLA